MDKVALLLTIPILILAVVTTVWVLNHTCSR
jgi:hypothetical protein